MKTQAIASIALAALFAAQTAPAQTPAGVPGQTDSPVLTLPAGTKIPLTLVSIIRSKTTHVGDSVRGQVAFPVTADNQVAIPAGTYVEGMVTKLLARAPCTRKPDVEIHFLRLLYANGYAVSLDAASLDALVSSSENETEAQTKPESATPGQPEETPIEGFGFVGQFPNPTPPTLPPLPHVGPSPAVIGGIAAGSSAALLGGLIWSTHHRGAQDYILRDAGWQFEMITQSPLTLDQAKVKAAIAIGN
jgi:hypothetical protein